MIMDNIDSTHGKTYTFLSRTMAQVPKVDDPGLLLDILGWVGTIKLNLPLITRSWLNELGLYVQLHYAAGQGRLQAGGMHRSYFDAWGKEGQALTEWEVRNYDRKTWRERFAHLVWPTYDLALCVGGAALWNIPVTLSSGEIARISELDDAAFREVERSMMTLVKQVVAHFNRTREWLGLVEQHCQSCGRRLDVWETHGRICPYCESELMAFELDGVVGDKPNPDISDAEVLDEICKIQSSFMVTRLAHGKGLSQAEINILRYKANPFYFRAFRVMETADENEINKWLSHPMVNHPWPDRFVMSMAAQTPIPVKMMEKMMRKLLREDYEEAFKKAAARIMARRSEHPQNNPRSD
jgi:hypothetical protein